MSRDVISVWFNCPWCSESHLFADIYLDAEVILKAPERCDAADIRHISALVTVLSFPSLPVQTLLCLRGNASAACGTRKIVELCP